MWSAWASPVMLLDGLLVDRLEDREESRPNTDAAPRRALETMFRLPPESLTLDIMPLPGQTVADDDVARRRRAAEMHFNERRWESALREYQQLMRLQPGHMPYVERAAVVATLAGRYSSADAYFHDIIQAMPHHVNYLAAWGNVLIRLLRLDDAGAVLQRALAIEPGHLMARHNMLVLNIARGEAVDFEYWEYRSFRDLIDVTEWLLADERELRGLLGDDLFRHLVRATLGDLPVEHLADFNRAIRGAIPFMNRKEWHGAYELLSRAQELGANLPFLQLERIRCVVEMGDSREAVFMAESLAIAHQQSPELMYGYAFILIKGGEYERAAQVLAGIVPELQDRPEVRFALTCALAGANRLDEAWPILTDLARDHPARMPGWMDGEAPYLQLIRTDPRYPSLSAAWR